MDIYSFIPSRDIAKHCRSIGYEFTPLEMAFIVYLSHRKLMTERHCAWQWIIDTQPDMEIPERRNMERYDSLHQFLRDYIALDNEIIDLFKEDEPNAVYSYECYYVASTSGPCECCTPFPTFEAVIAAIKAENEDEPIEICRVYKRWMGEKNKEISINIKPNGEIIYITRSLVAPNDEDNKMNLHGADFEGMWIEVPTPFKTGDIVIHESFWETEPFVLDYLCYWSKGERFTKEFIEQRSKDWDTTDMTAYGYRLSETGYVRRDHSAIYLSLEYYRGELNGKMRTLLALSNFIKENPNISDDLLLNAYEIILREQNINKLKAGSNAYIDKYLAMAGLIEGEEKEMTEEERDAYFGGEEGPFDTIEEMNESLDNPDIYDCIPSIDISYHCRKLGHTFTPLEQAVIIYHTYLSSIEDRRKRWQRIIDTLPDEKVIERTGEKGEKVHHESLHEYLREYMRIENALADRLKAEESDTIYTYSTRYKTRSETRLIEHDSFHSAVPYSTYDAVLNAVVEESKAENNCFEQLDKTYYVHKRWINTEKELSAQVYPAGDIHDFSWHNFDDLLSETDQDLLTVLDLIDIYVPVPFKKGDILTYDGWIPFVLTDDDWKYGKKKYPGERRFRAEGCIMDSVYSYTVQENGHIYWDFNPALLSLEYYRGKLTGLNRILTAISNHIKGKIPADLMMNACSIILNEEQAKSLRNNMHYTDEGLVCVGFKKEHTSR